MIELLSNPAAVSMISAAGGFLMRAKAVANERAFEIAQLKEKNYIKRLKLQMETSNAAANRVGSFGKVTRRTIGLFIVLSFVIVLAVMAKMGIPVVVESQKETNGFFGIGAGIKTVYTSVTGFFLAVEYRVAFISIVSFYFGQSAAK